MILHKLRWDLSSVTPLDFLDHILPRLGLPTAAAASTAAAVDADRLRRKTETIIALAATHTRFLAVLPSTLAAAAILTAARSHTVDPDLFGGGGGSDVEGILREMRTRLRMLTLAGEPALEAVCRGLVESLPAYLTGGGSFYSGGGGASPVSPPCSPDTTTITSSTPATTATQLSQNIGDDNNTNSRLSPPPMHVFADVPNTVLDHHRSSTSVSVHRESFSDHQTGFSSQSEILASILVT